LTSLKQSELNSMNYLYSDRQPLLHTLRDTNTEPSLWQQELGLRAKINLARQADDIYKKPLRRTGLFPTWIPGPGTRGHLFHGEQQVTK
jgi:hypothetical protein